MKLTPLSSKSIKLLFLTPSRSDTSFSWDPTLLAALKSCKMVSLLLTFHMHKNLEWNDWNWCQHFEILVTQNVEHSMKLWPLTCGCYMGWFHGRAEIWNSLSPSNHVLLCSFFCSCGFLCNVSNGFLALFIYLVSYFVVSTLFKKTNVTSGKKIDCSLKNNYLTSSVVYNANVTAESGTTGKNYIRLTEGTFKQRYTQHKLSFRNRNYSNNIKSYLDT